MKRLAVLLAAVAVAAVLAAPAGARIVPGQSIAGVKLGMTKGQVRSVLGTPTAITHGSNEFGTFTVFKYFRLQVTFQGDRTVTAVKTNRKKERTRHDIGVGSTRAEVLAKVPGVKCFRTLCQKGESLPGQRITAFFLYQRHVTSVLVGFVID